MIRPSTPTDVLKSMVDHPAGRHRRSITIPPAVSCPGTRHDQTGHARAERDAAPGTGLFDALGLVHALLMRMQVAMMPFRTLVFSGGH